MAGPTTIMLPPVTTWSPTMTSFGKLGSIRKQASSGHRPAISAPRPSSSTASTFSSGSSVQWPGTGLESHTVKGMRTYSPSQDSFLKIPTMETAAPGLRSLGVFAMEKG